MRPALAAAALAPVLLLAPISSRAGELSLAEIASLEREERIALERVEAAHGNRLPQELSGDERARIIHEQQAASRALFEQRSVDPKAFARRTMRLTPAERAQVNAEKRRLDQEEEERRAREAAAADAGAGELEVIRGIDERHPVEVYRDPEAVEVEYLQEGEGAAGASAAEPRKAPPKKSSRDRRRRRK